MKPIQNIPELKTKMNRLGLKVEKIPEAHRREKKQIKKKDLISMKRRAKRNLSYVSWLDNERRMINLITP
ncbi:MAG: hypothetical protein ABI792_05075 [bacterium]